MAAEKLTSTEQMLDELQELVLAMETLRDLGGHGGAAQMLRNAKITEAYNRGVRVVDIARIANVDRTWPYTVAKLYANQRAAWDRNHDMVQLLLNARKRVDFLLRIARQE